jgi:Exopolysaccharide biosynthesis protein YbjH
MAIQKATLQRVRRSKSWGRLGVVMLALQAPAIYAQSLGVSSQGNTGGLVIPSAEVLSAGTLALTYGNYKEPQLGTYATHQNMSLGIGLFPQLELFGRFVNYDNPIAGSIFYNGVRDISANFKLQLPTPWSEYPQMALGVTDLGGGAVFFSTVYGVATQKVGPLDVTLGYAQGRPILDDASRKPTFNGAFGGVSLRVGDTGVSVLAEHDGQQKHAGLRWSSPTLSFLGNSKIIGSVQRSLGAVTPTGLDANTTNAALTLQIPFGDNEKNVAEFKPKTQRVLPSLDAKSDAGGMRPTADDQLASLQKALSAVGLERVRVGLREGALGSLLVVEYENHRYAHNEVDALGLVFGLAAEMAPKGVQRVQAVTLKEGLRLYETSMGVAEYRAFLRDGMANYVRDSLSWDRLPTDQSTHTRWIDTVASPASKVRVEIKPELSYTLGTEIGVFDYSLAANLQFIAPLWSGARVYSSYIRPVTHSVNLDEGFFLETMRHRSGLKTLSLQQSFWMGNQILTNVAIGRFQYDVMGLQAETSIAVPDSDDVIKMRGVRYHKVPGGLAGQDRALSGTYRHMLTPAMWLEAGVQQYTDGSKGPTVEWTRWFGDLGVQLFYRKGGERQFAGLQLNIPLTPRQGMTPHPVVLTGASQYSQSIRTRLTTANEPSNLVQPNSANNLKLETSLDLDLMNAGRMSQRYLKDQVYRMREAFFMYTAN